MTLIKKLWDWLNEEIENTKKDPLTILNPLVQLGKLKAYKEVKQKLLEFAEEDGGIFRYEEYVKDIRKIVREEG